MRLLGSVLSFLFSVTCLALVVGALNNVYGDGHQVDQLAAVAACRDQGPHCNAQRTWLYRTPIAHTYEFVRANRTAVTVTCQRAFYVIGDYGCTTSADVVSTRAELPAPIATIR